MGTEWGGWDERGKGESRLGSKKKTGKEIAICLREITGEGEEIMQHEDNIQQGASLRLLYLLILKIILRDRKVFASTPRHEDGSIQGSSNSP